jgi:hypothetical protein
LAYVDSGYTLSQGRVFLAERALNGALTSGLEWVGDANEVQLSISQKTQPIPDFTRRGQIVAAPVSETAVSVRINALDTRLANWARATWGDSSGARVSGSVLAEAVTLYNGQYLKLARMGVSSLSIVGAVEDADYVVDSLAHGLVRVLAASVVAPLGTPFTTTAAYDYAASTGKVEGLIYGQKHYQVVVAGVNVAQGNQPTVLTIRQVTLQMATKLDALGRKPVELELNGELILDQLVSTPDGAGDLSQFFVIEKA